MLHEVDNTAGVSPLVIVPGNKLHESGVEHDSGTGIENGRTGIRLKIGGNKGLVAVSKNSLHLSLGFGLDDGADLLVGGLLSKTASQINDRHINGRNTEGHSGKLSLEFRDNLGHGLGGSGGGGNDVSRGGTSSAPVFAGGRVNDGLGGGHCVDGGHESFLDVELVVDSLHHGGKSVGGAGSAGDEVLRSVVFSLVDSHDDGLGVILGGCGVNDLLGASVNDGLGLLLGEEDSGGLADVVSSEGSPADLLGVAAAGGHNFLSVQHEEVSIDLNSSLGNAVDGVVLVLVSHVVGGGRSSVNGGEVAFLVLHHDAGHKTSDTSESVDSHSGGHGHGGSVGGGLQRGSGEGGGSVGRNGAGGEKGECGRELHCRELLLVLAIENCDARINPLFSPYT
mmetsp:Transcript_1324/g.2637  ORF Transcript_1324/g.2637 Transcript_1324/m.2637 type:complete len:394 (-) Transcript_1324:109-1290(-)